MKQTTGVIIVNYRGDNDTKVCLDSLEKAGKERDFRIYVVQPETQANNFTTHPIQPIVINRPENLGFAWANNLGINQAMTDGCSHFILLNNDTEVKAGFLEPLIRQLGNSGVGMVSPKIYFSPGREFHRDEYTESERGKVIWYAGGVIDWQNVYSYHWGVDEVDHGQFTEGCETDFATGCCLAVSRSLVEKAGLLDERYFLYLEDVDWSVRAKKKGFKIRFEPGSIIWHKNAGSTGGPGSLTHRYYQTRNRILFAKKYAPWRSKMAILRESIRLLKHSEPTEKQAVKDGVFGRHGKMKG
jgi:hypothetical protein